MELKHTPGPWFISPNQNYIRATGVHGWNIAAIEDQPPYTEANAKLIKAAPDLLDALNDLISPVDTIAAVPEGTTFTITFTVDQINKARIAIKKATG